MTALEEFRRQWPTSATNCPLRTRAAWNALTPDERSEALDAIPAVLSDLRTHRRRCICAGWQYLRQKRWQRLPRTRQQAESRP